MALHVALSGIIGLLLGSSLIFMNEGNRTRLGIPLTIHLEDLSIDGAWNMPPARTDNQVFLHAYLTTLSLKEEEYTYKREINGSVISKFSTDFFSMTILRK